MSAPKQQNQVGSLIVRQQRNPRQRNCPKPNIAAGAHP
jgi:hypothetical protein